MAHSNVYYFDTSSPSDIKCENVDEKTCTKMSLSGAATFDTIPESVCDNEDTHSPSFHDTEWAHGALPIDTLAIEKHCETADDWCTIKKKTNVCKPP